MTEIEHKLNRQPPHRRASGISSPERIRASRAASRAGVRRLSRPEYKEPTGEPQHVDESALKRYEAHPWMKIQFPKRMIDSIAVLSKAMATARTSLDYFSELDKKELDAGWPVIHSHDSSAISNGEKLQHHSPILEGILGDEVGQSVNLCSPSPPASLSCSPDPSSLAHLDRAIEGLKISTNFNSSHKPSRASDTPPYSPESPLPESNSAAVSSGSDALSAPSEDEEYAVLAGFELGLSDELKTVSTTCSPSSALLRRHLYSVPHDRELCVLLCCSKHAPLWTMDELHRITEFNAKVPHGDVFDEDAWNEYSLRYTREMEDFRRNDLISMTHAYQRVKIAQAEIEQDGEIGKIRGHQRVEWKQWMDYMEKKYNRLLERADQLETPRLERAKHLRRVHGLPI